MKTFAIYSKPNAEKVAVKVGISWPAFFFGGFWAFYKRMWLMMFAYIAIAVGSGMLDGYAEFSQETGLGDGPAMLVAACYIGLIVTAVWMSFRANDWYEDRLVRKGYDYEGKIEARNRSRAIRALESYAVTPKYTEETALFSTRSRA